MSVLRTYASLCRAGVALFAAGSSAAAFLSVAGRGGAGALTAAAGVFLLACAASALNQYQERDIDARMERTRRRPLPAGDLTPVRALTVAAALAAAGLAVLTLNGPLPAALGIAALAWYNSIYTPGKRRTAFASVYGVPVGAMPPAIGWAAGGGSLSDPRFFAVAAIFLVWQVPHFWLFLIRHDDDYRAAGLPTFCDRFGAARLHRMAAVWTIASAVVPLALPLFGVIRSPLVVWSLLFVMLATVASAAFGPSPVRSFRGINIHLAAVMVLLAVDPVLGGKG